SKPIPPEGLAALEKYFDRGGKLMVLFDVVTSDEKLPKDRKLRESGLEAMLKKYGIESTDEVAVTQVVINGVPMFQPINPAEVFSLPPDKAENVLAKQFYDTLIRFK